MKRLLIVLATGAALFTACQDEAPSFDSVVIDQPDELLSYQGSTVQEMVDINASTGFATAVCGPVDEFGYEEIRDIFIDVPPQLGSDEYEGAVFDASYARYC